MADLRLFRDQLPHTLFETFLPGLPAPQRGKVRDVYRRGDELFLVATDRLSVFDHVLTTVPFKGQLLNQLAAFWFEKTKDVADNHLLDVPDPNVSVVRRCTPLPVEVIVRAHLTGSLWRDYQAGRANAAYSISLPPGLTKDSEFPEPLVTPSTKAEAGAHDTPLGEEKLLSQGLVAPEVWREVRRLALALFARGRQWAQRQGLVLVDTKYEFGLSGDRVLVIDEIHTPDCSRYWIAEGWRERQQAGQSQRMLDKENIRQWLIEERQFSGHGPLPTIPEDVRANLAATYAETFERITGANADLAVGQVAGRIVESLRGKGYLPSTA